MADRRYPTAAVRPAGGRLVVKPIPERSRRAPYPCIRPVPPGLCRVGGGLLFVDRHDGGAGHYCGDHDGCACYDHRGIDHDGCACYDHRGIDHDGCACYDHRGIDHDGCACYDHRGIDHDGGRPDALWRTRHPAVH